MRFILLVLALCLGSPAAWAEDIWLVALNIERGWKPDAKLANVLSIINGIGPADIWAFSEVSKNDKDTLVPALGANFGAIQGTVGSDYLLLAYNKEKLEPVGQGEIELAGSTPGQRKPLWARLKVKTNGTEFSVVVNHFIRGKGDDQRRLGEAKDLHAWAQKNSPAIALGDFNLDFDVNYTRIDREKGRKQRSRAMAALIKDDVWAWVRPDRLMPTQCNPKYDSVLDFAFVAGAAKNWQRESRIVDIGCNDNASRPDHLPVELVISVP